MAKRVLDHVETRNDENGDPVKVEYYTDEPTFIDKVKGFFSKEKEETVKSEDGTESKETKTVVDIKKVALTAGAVALAVGGAFVGVSKLRSKGSDSDSDDTATNLIEQKSDSESTSDDSVVDTTATDVETGTF